MNILITGVSSGLGYALAKQFINEGHQVYGLSRTKPDLDIKFWGLDLNEIPKIKPALHYLLDGKNLDLVILNAGQLGELKPTSEVTTNDFNKIFNINVLSNKIIIDYLIKNHQVKNIVGISTGAALKPYFGWSLYCTTKAAFKQLISVYAEENPKTHFISLAPGIIKTPMQDYIKQVNADKIPSVSKFHQMFDTMSTAEETAQKIITNLPHITQLPTGDYFDLRNL